MLDIPNLLAGFLLGLIVTYVVWLHEQKLRRNDAWEAWKVAAKAIELLIWNPATDAQALYVARVAYPVDHWRVILGDRARMDLLEELERSYQNLEYRQKKYSGSYTTEGLAALQDAQKRRSAAITAFANFSRGAQDEGYNEVVTREQRKRLRRDYRRHPIATFKRQRRNRKMRGKLAE